MKTYQAVFNEDLVEGVFGISLVQDPAMEGDFIALKKEAIQLKEIDKEKRILLGLVLEPNKPVYRNQNGEEFNIIFSEDTIKDLSYNFFKSNYHKNSTIEHDTNQRIEGVTFVESWIVDDPKNDKSSIYGLSYPKGSWLAVMKVDSDEIWNGYVKNGKVKGFSIDAMLSLKEVNLKSNIEMSTIKEALKDFKNELLVALKLDKEDSKDEVKKVEIKMGSVKTADGSLTLEYEGDNPAEGGSIWVVAEDGTKVPLPVNEYPLEGGALLVVTEEGKIGSMGMPEKPQEEEAMNSESAAPSSADIASEIQNQIKSVLVKYAESQDKKIDELKAEIVELKKQPAARIINSRPTQVDFSKMTELQKRRHFRENA